MASADEERKEVRAQRHDFIKEYYRMAITDLDRHLKGGWQAIAVLAGGVAILTAGHDAKIGLPIATALALATAIWSTLTVIDSNYWSLRAIGFLSNAEAIYFSVEDRRKIHPYIGFHPKFKLMNSLKYLVILSSVFAMLTLLNMAWEIFRAYPGVGLVIIKMWKINAISFFFWSIPILVALWGGVIVFLTYKKRLADYRDFNQESPGPGVRLIAKHLRHTTLEALALTSPPDLETTTHDSTRAQLDKLAKRLDFWWWPITISSELLTVIILVVFVLKILLI